MSTQNPFDDRDGSIWFNGELREWRECKLHVLNHGLHYASSVFEGLRIYNGKPFKLEEHSQRLVNSAKTLGFTIPYSIEQINTATIKAAQAQNIVDGYIRPVAWLGSEKMKIYTEGNTVHLAIAAWEWPAYFDPKKFEQGISLCMAQWRRPAPDTAPTSAKAAGLYMICTLSKRAATEQGFDDALMLDYRGYVAEATGANFFMVVDGVIHTPIADCFLDGITRRTVIALAQKNNIEVIERHIRPEELGSAQEVFLTGTAAEITPVGVIADHRYTPGAVTSILVAAYKALVRA